MDRDELCLPEGSVLLHIGPYKTGSSALQASLHRSRDELRAHGVRYAGDAIRAMRPGWGVIGRTPRGRRPASEDEWLDLVQETRTATEPRVCVSTEDFARVRPEIVERIVRDLGADRLHVLVVVRRLDRLMPSQWQQRAQSFKSTTYDDYLAVVLDETSRHADHNAFWASHDVAATVGRWADAVGPHRVTLVVADESDRNLLPRTVERMLGLPAGLLAPEPGRNASLSLNAVEVLRRVNQAFAGHGWPDGVYHHLIRTGMLRELKQAGRGADELSIPAVPAAHAQRLRELSDERAAAVEALAARGVHVLGDPAGLRTVENVVDADQAPTVETISMQSAAAAVAGTVAGMMTLEEIYEKRHRRQLARARRRARPGSPMDEMTSRELARALARRAARRVVPGRSTR
ncbi:MAG: hypothetical protein ACLGIV_11685 [Actinomycetes bacterium]